MSIHPARGPIGGGQKQQIATTLKGTIDRAIADKSIKPIVSAGKIIGILKTFF